MKAFSVLLILFFGQVLLAQSPDVITVSGSTSSDGTYTHSGTMFSGCKCYENASGVILSFTGGNPWSSLGGTCNATGGFRELITTGGSGCNTIITGPFSSGVSVTEGAQVPTLSQWGLISLALMLLSIGVVALRMYRLERA